MIDPCSRFRIHISANDLAVRLNGFVDRVGTLVESGKDLDYSVPVALDEFPDVAGMFESRSGSYNTSFKLRDEILFHSWRPTGVEFTGPSGGARVSLDADPWDDIASIADLLRRGPDAAPNDILGPMKRAGIFSTVRSDATIDFEPDGIYRLQHACLLIRYRGVGILADPHVHSGFSRDVDADITLAMVKPFVDAIVISHPHEDHLYLSTLLMFDRDTPIIVPPQRGSSVINCDMLPFLTSAGLRNVLAPEWWSAPTAIGEIEAFALPFYGEQPLLDEPIAHAALRNVGSTFLFRCGDQTAWILIDSGQEHGGSMLSVAERVFDTFGSIDTVLSNLSEFRIFNAQYINGGLNWLTLPPGTMLRLPEMRRHLITLGPLGAAEVCRAVNARRYAPYAHWWGPVPALGATPRGLSDQEIVESRGSASLHSFLKSMHAQTEIVEWHVGDHITL